MGCRERALSRRLEWSFPVVAFVKYYSGDQIAEDEVCRTCSMHRVDEKMAYNFNRQTLRDLGSLNLDGGVFERMLKK